MPAGSPLAEPADAAAPVAPGDVVAARTRAIAELRAKCEAYERSFFSLSVLVIAADLRRGNKKQGTDTIRWVIALRRELLADIAAVTALTTAVDINNYIADYRDLGAPPFSEAAILGAAQVV